MNATFKAAHAHSTGEKEQRADRVQFLHFNLAATGMKGNHSPSFQPSMLLMFLCAHVKRKESESGSILVGVRESTLS